MRTHLVMAVLSFIGPSVCCAAPAPFPKPESGAEVVFDARTPERARLVLSYLRSDLFLNTAHQQDAFAKALPHQTETDRYYWLKAHLSVTAEGTLIRVRLNQAPGSLAALKAISAVLAGTPPSDDEYAGNVNPRLIRQAVNAFQGRNRSDADRGRDEIEDEPLRIRVGPRSLRRVRDSGEADHQAPPRMDKLLLGVSDSGAKLFTKPPPR